MAAGQARGPSRQAATCSCNHPFREQEWVIPFNAVQEASHSIPQQASVHVACSQVQ